MSHYHAAAQLTDGIATVKTGSGIFSVSYGDHRDSVAGCPTDLVIGALCS
jgi:hypothetical protein